MLFTDCHHWYFLLMESSSKTSHIKTFTFILDPITTPLSLPCELIPGCQFRRANEVEGQRIRDFLFVGGFNFMKEFDYGEKDANGAMCQPEPRNWKYFGIESATNAELGSLQLASNLLQNDLALGPSFIWMTDDAGHVSIGASGNPAKLGHFSSTTPGADRDVEITAGNIVEWRQLYEKIRSLDKEALKPFRALDTLKSVSPQSPLFALGLFAIVESIITHNPHDEFDSLTHQVSTKMVLLSKRFVRPLPYADFGLSPDKLWKKLYHYRSCIAHGATPDFGSGPLAPLKSPDVAHAFLTEALKLLLLDTIAEPDLIADLKEC